MTDTLVGVMLAAVRMLLIRAVAGAGSNGLVTTPTRAPSRTAVVAISNVSHIRLSSTMVKRMKTSVGSTRINSIVEVPGLFRGCGAWVMVFSNLVIAQGGSRRSRPGPETASTL